MSRETYVIRDGKLVPKHLAAPLEGRRDHRFMPDMAPIDLPGGKQLTSRSQLREHEQRYGIKQCGDDWTGSTKPVWWDAWKRGELRG
jgi:hypothetical protein